MIKHSRIPLIQGNKSFLRSLLIANLACLSLCAIAFAQEYPSKPVRIIVPFAAGGVADNSVRVVAERLTARLGQNFLVENKPGADGNIGVDFVAKAAADGYTLLVSPDSNLVIKPHVFSKLPFDMVRDFAPITQLGDSTLILVAHPSVPVKDVRELVAFAKQNNNLHYGTGGAGGTAHLAGAYLNERAGIELNHLPYKGGAASMLDVIGGHIPLVITAVATAQQYVKGGKLRGLGVLSAKRSAALPEVPTFAESGMTGFAVPTWVGILAPAKTQQPIIDKLNREIVAVLAEPAVKARYATFGLDPVGNTPTQFAAQIRDEFARWERVVKHAKIRID